MMDGFRMGISPLLTVSRVVGLGRLEYPPGQPRRCLTLLYIFALWIIYVIGIQYFLPDFLLAWHDPAYLSNLWFHIFIIFTASILNVYNDKKIEGCLKRFTSVDETLEALGVSIDYSKQYETTLRSVLVCFGLIICTLLCFSYYAMYATALPFLRAVCIVLIPNSVDVLKSIIDLQFGILLGCVTARLARVNECIQKSVNSKANKRGRFQERLFLSSRNPVKDEKSKRILWIAMHLHLEICKISRELNALFEIQISFEMMSIFVSLVGIFIHLYYWNVVIREGIVNTIFYIIMLFLRIGMHIGKLYYINNACDKASSMANSTKGFIDEAIDTLHNTEDRKDMMQFILRIMHKPLRFTGMGLFYFGHDFMRRLLVSVSTVVIIMLQMDFIPNIQ